MNDVNSPIELSATLVAMFPEFASEFEADEDVMTYHQVVLRLAPVITGYLRHAPTQLEVFCDLVNAMVAAGGKQEDAISTCLLEHASQIDLKRLVGPHLSTTARQLVR